MTRRALIRLAATAGAILLAVGIITGLVPVTRYDVACGNAYHASMDAVRADMAQTLDDGGPITAHRTAACREARGTMRALSLSAGIPGALLLLAGVTLAARSTSRDPRRVGSPPARP